MSAAQAHWAPLGSARLHSAQWFRVASLKPTLDASLQVQRQCVRGQVWQVLSTGAGPNSQRVSAATWAFLGLCNGQRSVQALWDISLQRLGAAAPTQDEWLTLLARLHSARLLSFDRQPDFGALGDGGSAAALSAADIAGGFAAGPAVGSTAGDTAGDAAGDKAARATGSAPSAEPAAPVTGPWWRQTLRPGQAAAARGDKQSLLAWRVPLGNPDAALARWALRLRVLFGAGAAWAWLVLMLWAVWAVADHATEISAALRSSFAAPRTWLIAAVGYPLLKFLHEAAHGLCARHFGAPVPQWGVSFLMFMPVAYVDASAASALPLRHQRLWVASAGIVLELSLAALALGLALQLQPGLWRDAAWVVCALTAGSALLVNANPLMRFDGYFMLCDAAGLPNLALRSQQHWRAHLQRAVLGPAAAAQAAQRAAPAPQPAPGEGPWLWLYAPAAWLMRAAVAWAAVLWVGSVAVLPGLLLGLLLLWQVLLRPLWRAMRWLHGLGAGTPSAPLRWRGRAALGLPLLAVLALPLPDATVAQGILWQPDGALVRAQVSGFAQPLQVADGQVVAPGDALLELHAPELLAQAEQLRAREAALGAERLSAWADDAARAASAEHGIAALHAEMERVQEQLQQLTLRAQAAGPVTLAQAADLPGKHLARGALLGHIQSAAPGLVRVAVTQEHAARVGAYRGLVSLRLANGHGEALQGWWDGSLAAASPHLPSAALGERSGGRLAQATPQTAAEATRHSAQEAATQAALAGGTGAAGTAAQQTVLQTVQQTAQQAAAAGLLAQQPVLVADVQLQRPTGARIGERVLVRFEHGHAPLAWQMASHVQRQLLRHFSPRGV